ncbi:MAG: hypothetical protein M1122_01145 [Candidatus Marsarchaeota archaeon]|nr:hypothetical protein [Candidatus Marsarchaeota archaeon]
MTSVAQVVAKMIESRPFLEEAIASEIVNYAYLADTLKPEIETELNRVVKRSAIVMALRRLSENMKKGFEGMGAVFFNESDITVKSGIFELTVERDPETLRKISKLYDIVDFSKGDFLTVTQGLYEITILSNERYRNSIEGLFVSREKSRVIDKLASITVRIPEHAVSEIGNFYVLTKALSWNNISIVELVSTFTEMTFIIRERDTGHAFEAVKNLVERSSKSGLRL